MNGYTTETIARMSISNTAAAGADLGAATFANPNVQGGANANAYRGAFPLGELVAKQPDVDGLGKSGPAPLDASPQAYSEEFSRLIITQKIRTPSSNIIAKADQCLKN